MPSAKYNGRQYHAYQPPVVGHPCDAHEVKPPLETERKDYFKGMVEVVSEIVEKDIAQPCPHYKAQRGPDKIALDVLGGVPRLFLPNSVV